MQHVRLFLLITLVCGWMNFANAASLFGGPKTLPDDGTWSAPSGERFSNPGNGSCNVTCRSQAGFIQVDIKTKCMCITGRECFRIDVGRAGTYTSNGVGTMGAITTGRKYTTKPGRGSTEWNWDGVDMGIQSNSAYGKWIHQSHSCTNSNPSTIGCIGVPCGKWAEVKQLALAHKTMQVCNGVDYPTSIDPKYASSCSGGRPCYAAISKERAARDRAGLNVARPVNGSGSDESGRR